MSKIIIVTGFLSTLKTTISKRLAKDLNMNSTHKDDLKEILSDVIGFTNREENLKLSKAAFELIHHDMIKHIIQDKDLIIESNFKSNELQVILDTISKKDTEGIIIYCFGQIDVLYKRYLDRQKSRHPAHLSAGTMSKSVFQASSETNFIPVQANNIIKVDTTYFNEASYEKLLQRIHNLSPKESL